MNLIESRPMQLLMWPGMRLMRALRFRAKMVVMSLLLVVPLTWLTFATLQDTRTALTTTQREAAATPLLGRTLELVVAVQRHRGLVNRVRAGDAAAQSPLAQARTGLKAALKALDDDLSAERHRGLAASWRPLKQTVAALADGPPPAAANDSFRLHTEAVEALRLFIGRIAEDSELLLDPVAESFHLMHFTVEPLVLWTEALGQLRGRGAAILKRGEAGVAERAAVLAQAAVLTLSLDSALAIDEALQRAGAAAIPGLTEAAKAARGYAAGVQSALAADTLAGDPAAHFDAGTQAIELAVASGRKVTGRLHVLLQERQRSQEWHWWGALAIGLGTMGLVSYLSLCFFRTSFGAMHALQIAVERLSQGDFGSLVKLRGTDELAVVAQSLDVMTGRLSELVADIRSNSTVVAQAGMALTTDSKSLSERTEAQAASLEQTSATVNELGSAVRQNAEAAGTASSRAAEVRLIAENGGQAVGSAVASMRDIQTSSARVQEIVGVIETLSFQTNLLALNAAVEAARAGEQGRGFAVVAAEVRSLAQRSASSAREIKQLIDTSAAHVATGATQINDASRTFERIVEGIREVAERLQGITRRTAEQSDALQQVAQAVQHIDGITQRNAQMVDTAFQNSSQLSDRADRLRRAVANFRLRQGGADEALALVQRAVALYRSQGPSALATVTAEAGQYADRDMYVFAFDRQGVYRAFAGNAAKVGTNVREVRGVDGNQLVQDAFERASLGGGWVDYDFTNATTGAVELKTSYVEPVETDLVIGCGVYKRREEAEGAPLLSMARTPGRPTRPPLSRTA